MSRSVWLHALAVLLSPVGLIAMVLAPARAQDAAALDRLIPADRLSCFANNYDVDHLRRNPGQQVTAFRLDFYPAYAKERGTPNQRFEFHAVVAARRPTEKLHSLGGCFTDEGVFECKLECDAGRFAIKTDSPDSLEIRLKGISLAGCGDTERLSAAADRVIRLRKLPDTLCKSPAQWDPSRSE